MPATGPVRAVLSPVTVMPLGEKDVDTLGTVTAAHTTCRSHWVWCHVEMMGSRLG